MLEAIEAVLKEELAEALGAGRYERLRSLHRANSVLSRAATRDTALFDRCSEPSNGPSALRMRRVLAPAR